MSKGFNAYIAVRDRIVELLDQGIVPWQKPWDSPAPRNAVTKHKYSGINYWLLISAGFTDPRWLTYNEITAIGGKIKDGEQKKYQRIVFGSTFTPKDDDDDNTSNKKKKSIRFLRYYLVWNVEQVEGLTLEPFVRETQENKQAQEIVDNYADAPAIQIGGTVAAYFPKKDIVKMPPQAHFNGEDQYYATLFHELAHSTGHESRLSRKGIVEIDSFGTSQYSEEELVAEMSAAFLCNVSGIESTLTNQAAYIAGWKKKLASEPNILVYAASKAQKAADYILGVSK